MKIREVIILPQVRDDLAEIIEFITYNTSEENALRYADELIDEINQLSYLADAMAEIPSKTLAQYHPFAQRLLCNNRKWCFIFQFSPYYFRIRFIYIIWYP